MFWFDFDHVIGATNVGNISWPIEQQVAVTRQSAVLQIKDKKNRTLIEQESDKLTLLIKERWEVKVFDGDALFLNISAILALDENVGKYDFLFSYDTVDYWTIRKKI